MISIRTGLALAGVLAALASCGNAELIDRDRDRWRAKAAAFKGERDAYASALKATRAAYDKSEALRSQEKADADQDLSNARKACSRDLEAVRTQEEQFRRLFTRPVRLKDGCPIREVWKAEGLGLKP